MTQKVINHWGVWIDSEIPITGVYSNNNLAWEFLDDSEICLTCESQIKEHNNYSDISDYDDNCPNCADCNGYCLDWLECDSSHDKIIGDWILNTKTGLYEIDYNGEFSAIVGEIYTQVVYSKHTSRCALCSPCYPGQGDIDTKGDFLTYTLPEWAVYKND